MNELNELVEAADALHGFESVPGLAIRGPSLGPPLVADELDGLTRALGALPEGYRQALAYASHLARLASEAVRQSRDVDQACRPRWPRALQECRGRRARTRVDVFAYLDYRQ